MYDAKDGKRQILYSAVERYKRLDWGMYVGTKTGRYNKRWKKWDSTNWSKEQHMFMDRESNLVLERMFSHDIKLPRYIPDDPWQKYNEMPFWRHRAGLLKNRKLIEKHGNTDHMYGRYMSHMKGTYGKDNIMPKHYYILPADGGYQSKQGLLAGQVRRGTLQRPRATLPASEATNEGTGTQARQTQGVV